MSDHNIEKQITDSRDDIAYLIADLSNVSGRNLQELYDNLEALSCKLAPHQTYLYKLTLDSANYDSNITLEA